MPSFFVCLTSSYRISILELRKSNQMPSVSHFRGIAIHMYTERDIPHRLPHFHAYYGEHSASFAINPPSLLQGSLPRRQLRLVLAWAELRQEELEENWQRVQSGRTPHKIQGI